MSTQPLLRQGFRDRPLLSIAGDLLDVLVTGSETDGRYAAAVIMVPPGAGPPPHKHTKEDEGFLVMEGELTFTADGRDVVAPAGSYVHLSRGAEHTFRNSGRSMARAMIWITPAGFEQFFAEVGQPVPAGSSQPIPLSRDQMELLARTAPRYGVEIRVPT